MIRLSKWLGYGLWSILVMVWVYPVLWGIPYLVGNFAYFAILAVLIGGLLARKLLFRLLK